MVKFVCLYLLILGTDEKNMSVFDSAIIEKYFRLFNIMLSPIGAKLHLKKLQNGQKLINIFLSSNEVAGTASV